MKKNEDAKAKIANKAFQKICRSDLGVPRIGKDVYPETTKLTRAFFRLVAHDIDADLKLTGHRTISSAHIRKFAAKRGINILRPSAELCKQHSTYNRKFRSKRKAAK
jgi:hypothetical protein